MTLAKAPASRFSSADVSEEGADDQATPMAIIAALGGQLCKMRDEAMAWRTNTGIEQDWLEDEEFYDARDRANLEGESNVGKPVAPEGGAINQPQQAIGRSSVFIPITRAYVDAGSARVADMLLPSDDAPWQLKATPRPDMGNPASDAPGGAVTPIAQAAAGMTGNAPMPQIPGAVPGLAPQAPGPSPTAPAGMGAETGMPAPAAGGVPPGPITSQVYEALPDEEKAAERANKVIEDWLIECQWHAETRKAIEDAAKLGTGILKGPFPMLRRSMAYRRDPVTKRYVLQTIEKVVPVTKRVHPRNFWPMPDGGENHQASSGCFELDNISSRQLRELLRDDSYIHENILRALREGPGAKSGKDVDASAAHAHGIDIGATFPLWYAYFDLDKRTLVEAGVPENVLPPGDDFEVSLPTLAIMVNDHVIKVSPAPLDAGGFPYDMFPWQRRPGIPWGKGIARQVRTPQRMLNAAVRAMMDNGALSSGPIYAIRQDWIVAIDGNNAVLTPRKGFYMTNKAPPNAKIEDAISFTNIQSNVAELNTIIDRAMRFAEDATGMPMLMQGQQGEATTTATGMTILNNNGSTVLRRIARTFDDYVTEPHIRRYYYWLMANEGNDDAKGDFQIDARGSTYLVDRELQAQNLNQLYPMLVQHPDVHPGRLAEEVAAANRLPLNRIFLTDAEKKQRDSQPPAKPERVQIAEMQMAQKDKELQVKDQQHLREMQVKEGELQAMVEKGIGELAAKIGISEDSIKAMLAVKAMDLQASRGNAREQRQHERTSAAEDRASNGPPGEPPHKAPAGGAYAQ
jgi:hypothetical protein